MPWRPVVERLIRPEDRFPLYIRDQIIGDGMGIPDLYDGPYLDTVETTEGFARHGRLLDESVANFARQLKENPPETIEQELGPIPRSELTELSGGYGVPENEIAFVFHALGRAFIWKRAASA